MIPIEVEDVTVAFDGTRVLDGFSLEVPAGTWIGIIGPNGAGKTTLLRAIAGLVGFEGRVTLDGRDVTRLDRRGLARLVAYVPQQPLIPRATPVADYALMGRTPYISYFGVETKADLDVVGDVLERLELVELAERPLGSLSGGEFQRVVLARALAQRAPVLLLDEPTTGLDVGHQQQVLELVDSLRTDHELTVVSCMHDLTLAGQFSDLLVLVDGGRVAVSGRAASVLTEEIIRTHFGANVRVLEDEGGGFLIAPRRAERGTERERGM